MQLLRLLCSLLFLSPATATTSSTTAKTSTAISSSLSPLRQHSFPQLMAEREPPRTATVESPDSHVVHIPKDQIYRPPQLGDAYSALPDDGRNNDGGRRVCGLLFPCFSSLAGLYVVIQVIFVMIVIDLASGGVTSKSVKPLVKPESPEFTVDQLVVVASPGIFTGVLKPEYSFNITIKNPDEKFEYRGGMKGAVLSHEDAGIAAGGMPPLLKQEKEKAAAKFGLGLLGTYLPVDKEVEGSLEGTSKGALRLGLAFDFTATCKLLPTLVVEWNIDVKCDVEVSGLANQSRIVSQNCVAKLF